MGVFPARASALRDSAEGTVCLMYQVAIDCSPSELLRAPERAVMIALLQLGLPGTQGRGVGNTLPPWHP